jgi:CheY-like chemotaxis protein
VDTGIGMSEEVMRHLFEPFFTTKPTGRGMGLGLATVQNTVTRYGGSIEVSSTLGRGTEIRILLPLIENPAPDREIRAEQGGDPRRANSNEGVILICERDAAVAGGAEVVLRDAGFVVKITASGKDALALARQLRSRVHLLLTELNLTDMGGHQLAELVRRLCPDVQVVYLSNPNDGSVTDSGYIELSPRIVAKPFSPAALLESVRAALANRLVSGSPKCYSGPAQS